ncbi:MAG: adenosylcobinamide-GDP ribazoletransferase [Alphaproteobacteria bacterium]|nr:adenosylcobinamide-GDP ribazoletransferase [Alphaproteobacteria bacterium]MBU1277666.1 adenosylcobinamide-GDP ribazoletransferase [Alphaproteobacteria bacterium]MBU1574535.1 adenosylcobinamide-GDP ribazoletransferase [Alphaproteobacteria bacterium]MBU1827247.1 adenosylcobinamide-GDP ribazoletransferase [Alphaproteobacteria bacterium]MBU2079929.1 adenosylcobinamide-GDP ribazoletransferase [Alphaproteobacteria bacterium]
MTKADTPRFTLGFTPRFKPRAEDIATSLALLTRIPVKAGFTRTAQAAWAFPVAGLAVGLVAGAVATIAGWFGLGASLTAGFAMAAAVIVTGAMHEDGLADCADGFWGGWERLRRLEIMHDSRIGTYGVLALGLALLFRFSALSVLAHEDVIVTAHIASAVLSRASLPYVMLLLPHARADGLSVKTGRPPRDAASLGAGMALALSWIVVGFVPTVIAASVVMLISFVAAKIALSKIGGQTGDVLGATQVLCEIAALTVFTALA